MATLANLVVEISAKQTKLKTGLRKSLSMVTAFSKKAISSIKKIGTVFGLIFTGAALVGITKFVNQVDRLNKVSGKLGINIQALQKLQFFADQGGVSTDTLNMALQRMVRRVAEAAAGTGEAQGALRELGLDAAQLTRLDPAKQFEAIGGALGRIKSSSKQLALAFKVFDSEGVGVINVFKANLKELGEEYDKLGLGVSKAQADAISGFKDSFSKIGTVLSSLGQKITAGLSVPMKAALDALLAFVKRSGGIDRVAVMAMRKLGSIVIGATEAWFSFTSGIDSAIDKFSILRINAASALDLIASKGERARIAAFGKEESVDSLQRTKDLVAQGVAPKQAAEQAVAEQKEANRVRDAQIALLSDENIAKRRVESVKKIEAIKAEAAKREAARQTKLIALRKMLNTQIEKGARLVAANSASLGPTGSGGGSGTITLPDGRVINISNGGDTVDGKTTRSGGGLGAAPTVSNRGFIRDESTGRSLNFRANEAGNPVTVNVNVTTEEGVIVDKVTSSDKFKNTVKTEVRQETKTVARQVAQ